MYDERQERQFFLQMYMGGSVWRKLEKKLPSLPPLSLRRLLPKIGKN